MKKYILLLFITIWGIAPIQAQEQMDPPFMKAPWTRVQPQNDRPKPAFSPWEYMKKEDEFITKKAKLTMVEANTVCPLLHKMKDEQRKVDRQIRRILDQGNNANLSEQGSLAILKKRRELFEEKNDIEKKYHRQMLKIISAKKLLQLLQADVVFDRMMLQQMFMNKHKDFKSPENDKPNR